MAKAQAKDEPAATGGDHDVALVHSPTEDGKGARVVRLRNGQLSSGEIRPVVEGQPLAGYEVVRLRSRQQQPGLCDVEVLYDGTQRDGSGGDKRSAGPARVSSDAYRRGWGQVFATRKDKKADGGPDRSLN